MSRPRIAPLDPPYADPVAEDFAALMPPGVDPLMLFRVVGRNPRVLRRMRRGGLLDPGTISVREREIAILRTTARCGSEYEWGVHVAFFGDAAHLSVDERTATVRGDERSPCWSPSEAAIIALADALHERSTIDASIAERLEAHFTEEQRIELVMLVGLYHAVSFLTNAFSIPNEASAPRFPRSDLAG